MDITHDFWIDADAAAVFRGVTESEGLNAWWTLTSQAAPSPDGIYELGFGPGYDWKARVVDFVPDTRITWVLVEAAEDWQGTQVSFALEPAGAGTTVHFVHSGWSEAGRHFRISSYCWAMYLRLLKRYVQHDEIVPYDQRLEA